MSSFFCSYMHHILPYRNLLQLVCAIVPYDRFVVALNTFLKSSNARESTSEKENNKRNNTMVLYTNLHDNECVCVKGMKSWGMFLF